MKSNEQQLDEMCFVPDNYTEIQDHVDVCVSLKNDGTRIEPKEESCITFNCDKDTWFLKIRNGRFEFNEERFPDMAPSDYAREFLHLLKMTKLIQDFELPPL